MVIWKDKQALFNRAMKGNRTARTFGMASKHRCLGISCGCLPLISLSLLIMARRRKNLGGNVALWPTLAPWVVSLT